MLFFWGRSSLFHRQCAYLMFIVHCFKLEGTYFYSVHQTETLLIWCVSALVKRAVIWSSQINLCMAPWEVFVPSLVWRRCNISCAIFNSSVKMLFHVWHACTSWLNMYNPGIVSMPIGCDGHFWSVKMSASVIISILYSSPLQQFKSSLAFCCSYMLWSCCCCCCFYPFFIILSSCVMGFFFWEYTSSKCLLSSCHPL